MRPDLVVPDILAGPRDQVGERIVRYVLESWEDDNVRRGGILLLRTTVGNKRATPLLVSFLRRELLSRIAGAIGTDDAELRASLVASQISPRPEHRPRRPRPGHPARAGHRAARSLGMRQDDADEGDRRSPENNRWDGDRARRARRVTAAAEPGGLRHAGRLGLRRPHGRAEPALLRPVAGGAALRRRPGDRAGRAARPTRADGRHAQRRPAEPGLARRRDARGPAAPRPRRADGRSRPPAARRAVGRLPRAGRLGRDAPGVQPRDGRGAALRPGAAHAPRADHRRHHAIRAARGDRRGRPDAAFLALSTREGVPT